jgi:hypothetical protein
MADVDKILRLVSEGVLTPEEADEILGALDVEPAAQEPAKEAPASAGGARQLRIEVTEGGRRVVNLRVPINIAGWASAFLPGLSDDETQRIRSAIDSGVRGPILDIGGDDGSRVLITSE